MTISHLFLLAVLPLITKAKPEVRIPPGFAMYPHDAPRPAKIPTKVYIRRCQFGEADNSLKCINQCPPGFQFKSHFFKADQCVQNCGPTEQESKLSSTGGLIHECERKYLIWTKLPCPNHDPCCITGNRQSCSVFGEHWKSFGACQCVQDAFSYIPSTKNPATMRGQCFEKDIPITVKGQHVCLNCVDFPSDSRCKK